MFVPEIIQQGFGIYRPSTVKRFSQITPTMSNLSPFLPMDVSLYQAVYGTSAKRKARASKGTLIEFEPSHSCPMGLRIASGSNDGTLRVWDAKECCAISEPLQTDYGIYLVVFARLCVILAGSLSTVYVWDAKPGILSAKFDIDNTFASFSSDGSQNVGVSPTRSMSSDLKRKSEFIEKRVGK
jgi:WD40 repeat protein